MNVNTILYITIKKKKKGLEKKKTTNKTCFHLNLCEPKVNCFIIANIRAYVWIFKFSLNFLPRICFSSNLIAFFFLVLLLTFLSVLLLPMNSKSSNNVKNAPKPFFLFNSSYIRFLFILFDYFISAFIVYI